jgi:hypothetical protein
MTTQADPYTRVYYRVLNDPKFAGMSSAAWGHWVRLLVIADGMYPAPAPVPRWVEDGPMKELQERGIIDLEGEDYFRIHGMTGERATRSEAATFAADVRHVGQAEAERRRAERIRTQNPGSAPALPPHAGAHAEPASPLLSAPIQSTPSRASPPARPGGGGLASIGSTLADLVPPPPGHRRSVTRPPADEELVAQHRRVLAEPKSPPWLVQQARDGLRVMGYPEEADASQPVGASRNGSRPP